VLGAAAPSRPAACAGRARAAAARQSRARAWRAKKVPVLVRTVLSMLLPVSLSTTVDLTMVGLACRPAASASAAAQGGASRARQAGAAGREAGAAGRHLADKVGDLLLCEEVFEQERARLPGHLHHLPAPLHLRAVRAPRTSGPHSAPWPTGRPQLRRGRGPRLVAFPKKQRHTEQARDARGGQRTPPASPTATVTPGTSWRSAACAAGFAPGSGRAPFQPGNRSVSSMYRSPRARPPLVSSSSSGKAAASRRGPIAGLTQSRAGVAGPAPGSSSSPPGAQAQRVLPARSCGAWVLGTWSGQAAQGHRSAEGSDSAVNDRVASDRGGSTPQHGD